VKKRILVIALLSALAVPGSAWAHATLVRTVPADGAVLDRAPAEVRVVFDDVVRVGPGVAAIRNSGGTVLAGKARVEGGRTLVIPLKRGLADGDYSVRWGIVSDDGHLESGVIAFGVGAGRTPPAATLVAQANGPSAGSVATRWLFFAGLLGAAGIALFALLARPRDEERIALILSSSAVVAAFGAAEEAHRAGLGTRAGTALAAGFVAAVVVASLAGAATLEHSVLRPALLLAVGLVAVPSFAGHALDRGLNRINIVADILHVAGAAAWVGALLGLVLFRDAPQRRAVQLAAGGVLLLGVTGILRACFELVRFSQLWDTSYGQALLVKTGIALAALSGGWLLRARIRRRAGAELLLVGGLVVAVSVLVMLRPGRNVEAALVQRVQATQPTPQPPLPSPRALVLAQQVGPLGVALQLEPRRTTAVVLSPAGGGLSGLGVRIGGKSAHACGYGCYRVDSVFPGSVDVEVQGFGATLSTSFERPRAPRAADALVRRAAARYRSLRSVFYVERLASSPARSVTSLWRLERPDRVSYVIPGGAQGIVIGGRRWDRDTPDASWKESSQTPLVQPATAWSGAVKNAHLIADTGETKTVTFVDPATPAYFEVTFDSRTLLPRIIRMTASAHFMTERYVRFNAPRAIFPPR
jgi:methionine-rich copper-binding protein CopC